MSIWDLLKKKKTFAEPAIPECDKPFYREDKYYTDCSYPGTPFERRVIPFEERKNTSYPSKRGLYVAEILLLEYCSYGTYPNPKTGYPGFWWFSYGIRNVGFYLQSLADRGFIEFNDERKKYYLTTMGETELGENLYIPYMHKHKKKTTEAPAFGPEFNVWSINRLLAGNTKNWKTIVTQEERKLCANNR